MSLNLTNLKPISNFRMHRIDNILNDFKEIFEEKVRCIPKF